jgi:hypothetical protein
MPRSKSDSKTPRERLKALPWAALARGGYLIRRRWKALSEKDRARLTQLLRESGGQPHKLAPKQRKELRALARKLDLKGIGEDLLPLLRGGRGGRKCRRRKSA